MKKICFLTVICLFASCGAKQKTAADIINIDTGAAKTALLSELVDSISYIQMETIKILEK
jgi:hypothetical protein